MPRPRKQAPDPIRATLAILAMFALILITFVALAIAVR
jgi:hypothetical protein